MDKMCVSLKLQVSYKLLLFGFIKDYSGLQR